MSDNTRNAPRRVGIAEERKAFEDWAFSQWNNSHPPQAAWTGWQARAALHEMQMSRDLEGHVVLLRKAIEADDPKAELLLRVDDILSALRARIGEPSP